MIKKILLAFLGISSIQGNAQYSSLGFKSGVFRPEVSDPDDPLLITSGVDYKNFIVSFGTEQLALDFGWGVGINSINSRIKEEFDILLSSSELLYSINDENTLQYEGSVVSKLFISNNMLQLGPTINFKLGKKLRFNYFYGLGAGLSHNTFRTKFENGRYSGSGAVSNLADKLNQEDVQGFFLLTDNSKAPEFMLSISESERRSFITSITRNAIWEAGFEIDLSEKISLGISYSRLKFFSGSSLRSFGTKVKGKSLNYQSTGFAPSVGEVDNFSRSIGPENKENSDFRWVENGKPEAFGDNTMLKITIYL